MLRVTDISLPINHAPKDLGDVLARILKISPQDIRGYDIQRKAVDARRQSNIVFVYTVDVDTADEADVLKRLGTRDNVCVRPEMEYQFVAMSKGDIDRRPVVVGAGPCGLFSALLLAQMGLRPILLDRGKCVRDRSKDVYHFWKTGTLDTESNVQFGEGGAGAFSDGKLTTQIKDKSNRCRKVIQELIAAGAPEEIAFLNKPHIGTDRLVSVVAELRRRIESLGGEVRMQSRVADIVIGDGGVRGVDLADGDRIETNSVILAIGHSARDTFEMLKSRGVAMAAKPFSIGVRIEHPQTLIDTSQYGKYADIKTLGAADYKLVHHSKNGRSAYSFCMCPGGEVIASSSEAGGVVTNGMSIYARSRPNANSGLLVGVGLEDFGSDDVLAGVAFQRRWERLAFELGGRDYKAPAQRLEDFLKARPSTHFGDIVPSYTPGVVPADLSGCLPEYVIATLRESLEAFNRKIRGFAMPDAVLTGVETRSSSPVRILRGDDGQSINVKGLYPAGEGAGYAGGIVSSAVDGIKTAEFVALAMLNTGK